MFFFTIKLMFYFRSIVEERLWTLNSNCTSEEKEFLNKTIVNLKSLRNESCQIKDLEPAFQSSFR